MREKNKERWVLYKRLVRINGVKFIKNIIKILDWKNGKKNKIK
jgi:hypothetical protein